MSGARQLELSGIGSTKPDLVVWPYPHIELRDDSPFIKGTPVSVRRLWYWHKRGLPIATLIARYPTLGAAKVLSALAFAYDNVDRIAWDVARSEGMTP